MRLAPPHLSSLSVAALLLLSVSSLLGCHPDKMAPKYPSEASFGVKPYHVRAQFVPLWQKPGPSLQPFGSLPQQIAGAAYSPVNDTLILPNNRGDVSRFQATNGDLLWSRRYDGYAFHATPAVAKERIYLPSLSGGLLVVREANGDVVWEASADNSLEGTPAVNRDVVVALDTEDVLYCWDATDGKELWRYAHERTHNFTITGTATPYIEKDTVTVGFAGGEVIQFDLSTGKKRWTLDLSGGETEFADVDTLLPGKEGLLYATSRRGGLVAIELTTGRVMWRAAMNGVTTMEVRPDSLVVATSAGRLLSLSPSGTPLWSFKFKDAIATSIVSYGPYLVVAAGNGSLYLFDSQVGFPFHKWIGQDGFHAPFTFGGDRIYTQSDRGHLFAMKVGWKVRKGFL